VAGKKEQEQQQQQQQQQQQPLAMPPSLATGVHRWQQSHRAAVLLLKTVSSSTCSHQQHLGWVVQKEQVQVEQVQVGVVQKEQVQVGVVQVRCRRSFAWKLFFCLRCSLHLLLLLLLLEVHAAYLGYAVSIQSL
jgi:hypothetical protein